MNMFLGKCVIIKKGEKDMEKTASQIQKERIKELEEQSQEKNIHIEELGSIAEASLKLNGVFESAQAAADQYLENIQNIHNNHILYQNLILHQPNS